MLESRSGCTQSIIGVQQADAGQPDLTLPLTGEPQRAEGTDREHATYIVLLESSMMNTGEPGRDVKEGGE
jgi:hypothetical protein